MKKFRLFLFLMNRRVRFELKEEVRVRFGVKVSEVF